MMTRVFNFFPFVIKHIQQWLWLVNFHKSAKLTSVIIYENLVLDDSDEGVHPADRYICYFHVSFYRPSDSKLFDVVNMGWPSFVTLQVEDMDDLRWR